MAYYKGDGKKEVNVLEGSVKLREPDLTIKPQKTLRLENIGTALTGLYYIEEVSIEVSANGVEQTVSVSRNGFTDTIKMNNAKAPSDKKPKEPKKPSTSKPQKPKNKTKVHTVKKGDTLWDISKKYYGKPELWTKLYKANKSNIKNPHWIYPGQKFVIP